MGQAAYTLSRCAAASLVMLLAAAPAFAQDTAATPSYPLQPAKTRVKAAHPRRPPPASLHKRVAVPLPRHRPEPARAKPETPERVVSLPLPQERPAAAPLQPKSEPAAAPVPAPKAATAPAQEPPWKEEPVPVSPPIKEGGANDWRVVTDPATGIVIGIPRRLLTQMHDAPKGTRWSAAHGEIQLETFRLTEPGLTLAALFEKMKREPANRKVEFNTMKDDSFVLGGTQGLRDFYIRASVKNGEVRGFTLIYDVAMETIMEPLRGTISNAFNPFPDRPAGFALPSKAVDYGSGVVVSREGHIVTSARLTESCNFLRVTGLGPAESLAASDGLALLRVYGARVPAPMAISKSVQAGPLTVLGVPDPNEQQGAAAARELGARLKGEAIELAKPGPLAGFSGAAALDAQGRLAGLVDLSGVQLASAGAPPLRMIGAAAIRDFLAREGVEPYEESGAARTSVVRVICVRK